MSTDFLATWDKSDSEIGAVLDLAQKIWDKFYGGEPTKMFESGLAVSIFKDKSTRTRYSYCAAANLVGLEVEELDEGKSQITHGETVMETANMVSFLTRAIGIRDDIFLGVGHKFMEQTAKALDWECDEKLMRLTKGGKALYMHCLPADISGVSCRQGEVSAEVFEKYKKQTYLQASYKPFIIAAMMVRGQFGSKAASKI